MNVGLAAHHRLLGVAFLYVLFHDWYTWVEDKRLISIFRMFWVLVEMCLAAHQAIICEGYFGL